MPISVSSSIPVSTPTSMPTSVPTSLIFIRVKRGEFMKVFFVANMKSCVVGLSPHKRNIWQKKQNGSYTYDPHVSIDIDVYTPIKIFRHVYVHAYI